MLQTQQNEKMKLPTRGPPSLTTDQSLRLLALELKADMIPFSILEGNPAIEHRQRPTEACLSVLPAEVISRIFKYAVVYNSPISLDLFFKPVKDSIGIDLRFLLYSDNYENWASICLRHAFENNKFILRSSGISMGILQLLQILREPRTFQRHTSCFEYIRHLRIPLPIETWSQEEWVEERIGWASCWANSVAIISGFLHRFARLETLEFEETFLWDPDLEHYPYNSITNLEVESLGMSPVRPSLIDALVRSKINVVKNEKSDAFHVTYDIYKVKFGPDNENDRKYFRKNHHGSNATGVDDYILNLLKHHNSLSEFMKKPSHEMWDIVF